MLTAAGFRPSDKDRDVSHYSPISGKLFLIPCPPDLWRWEALSHAGEQGALPRQPGEGRGRLQQRQALRLLCICKQHRTQLPPDAKPEDAHVKHHQKPPEPKPNQPKKITDEISNSFPALPEDSIPTSPIASVRASPSLGTIPSRHAKCCPTFGILTLPTPWETIPAQNYSPETGTSTR